MAESFIFSIVESLIEKLASRAFQEASEALDVYDHLREFEKTLSLVKAVLLDAEQKQEHNHELRQWLRQLKSVFYDAEDVLDEFECQTLRKQVLKVHGNIKDEVSHFFSSSNPLVFHCKMAQKIKDCSKRLDKVAADRHKFGLRIIDVDTRVKIINSANVADAPLSQQNLNLVDLEQLQNQLRKGNLLVKNSYLSWMTYGMMILLNGLS
ncbi:hypothetical protein AAZX31_19G077000 [Glycine max]|nr:hypothetical protein GLYMA_19G085932v4 [Glycine max]KAH1076944.1 hypothetical protein GYH30_052452 [Glycine max]